MRRLLQRAFTLQDRGDEGQGDSASVDCDSRHYAKNTHEGLEFPTAQGAAHHPRTPSPLLDLVRHEDEDSAWNVCESMAADYEGNEIPQP